MISQLLDHQLKRKRSRLNLLQAHLRQLYRSSHFSDQDRLRLAPYYISQIENLKNDIECLISKNQQ